MREGTKANALVLTVDGVTKYRLMATTLCTNSDKLQVQSVVASVFSPFLFKQSTPSVY
jgi:hypothetical protein